MKLIKITTIILICLSVTVYAQTITTKDLKEHQAKFDKLDSVQKENLLTSYDLGKTNDIGLTIAAIAWQESEAGKFQINNNRNGSWDCGLFGNNTQTILNNAGENRTIWNKKLVCTRLITDRLYAYEKALAEINTWKNYWAKSIKNSKDLWYHVWGSYNGGANPNFEYSKDIHIKTKVLALNLSKLHKRKS